MSFTQEKTIQNKFCEGCEKRCKLGYEFSDNGTHVIPTIGGEKVTSYVDIGGYIRVCVIPVETKKELLTTRQALEAMSLAGRIAGYCDKYKTR